jgi:hypothetical protein
MSDTLLEEGMAKGYRYMHIARMGVAPDLEFWLDQIPPDVDYSAVLPVMYKSNRDGLDMFHLQIYWYAAEVIRMVYPGGREQWSAWWWLGKEPHITYYTSTAIEVAAIRFFLKLKRWPVWAAIPLKDEPGRAKVPKEIRFMYEGAEVILPIIRLAWVPRNFVVVLGNPTPGPSSFSIENRERILLKEVAV